MKMTIRLSFAFAVSLASTFGQGECLADGSPDTQYRYRYVSLSQAALPSGYASFIPAEVIDSGKVYGTLLRPDDPDLCAPAIGVWQAGRVRVFSKDAFGGPANSHDTVAGSVVRDCTERLALIRKGKVELIPSLPGDLFSFTLQLTDSRIALIASFTSDSAPLYLYRRGQVKPLPFGTNGGEGGARAFPAINGSGTVAGTYVQPGSSPFAPDTRAFRYRSGALTLLKPRPTEPISWGEGINQHGDVLGYSFVSGGREAIGVWRDRPGNPFQTYFVEGTAQFRTVSNDLLWNEPGLIVITGSFNDPDSYIVPRPWVRLNLADITTGMPAGRVTVITDLNDRGDLLGFNYDPNTDDPVEDFLLQRLRDDETVGASAVAPISERRSGTRAVSWRVSHPERLATTLHGKVADRSR